MTARAKLVGQSGTDLFTPNDYRANDIRQVNLTAVFGRQLAKAL